MSNVTQDDVRHLAQLSNLELTEEQTTSLQVDLDNILGYIEQLAELDTEGVEPTYQTTGLSNVMRDDVVESHPANREVLLELAPDSHDDQVKVPKVL